MATQEQQGDEPAPRAVSAFWCIGVIGSGIRLRFSLQRRPPDRDVELLEAMA